VEYELGEKLLLLRQQSLLASGNKRRMWELLVRSVSSFVTLFRHALMVLQQDAPVGKRESVQALAELLDFEALAMLEVLDVRENKAKSKGIDVDDLFARYLAVVEKVTAAVDRALETDKPAGS
jgi:hypothetical protein